MKSSLTGMYQPIPNVVGENLNVSFRVKGKVMEIRKAKLSNPWPPEDRNVGVILVAHSMG